MLKLLAEAKRVLSKLSNGEIVESVRSSGNKSSCQCKLPALTIKYTEGEALPDELSGLAALDPDFHEVGNALRE